MEKVTCFIPETLNEALKILSENDCIIMAGGSDLMVSHKKCVGLIPEFEKPVLLIRKLKELQNISIVNGECVIGSCCTSAQISDSLLCPWHLRQAASRMGAVALRNSATIGGNICNASPKGDMPGPLYLLDARVRIQSLNSMREIPVKDFILKFKTIDLKKDEMVTEIIVPLSEDDFDYVFWHKVGTRKSNAISKITLGQAIKFSDDGKVIDYRVSATASGAVTNRNREVEKIIIGKKPDSETIEKVIEAFDRVISPRAMPVFRREAVKRMIRRFLTESTKHPVSKIIDTYDGYYVVGQPEVRS